MHSPQCTLLQIEGYIALDELNVDTVGMKFLQCPCLCKEASVILEAFRFNDETPF